MEVSRECLLDLVHKWEAGILSEKDIHEIAEQLIEEKDLPQLSDSDPSSIEWEVLSQLDILNHQLITSEDIPAIIDFLSTPLGQEINGWRKWRAYWNNVDIEFRRHQLKNNPFYIT